MDGRTDATLQELGWQPRPVALGSLMGSSGRPSVASGRTKSIDNRLNGNTAARRRFACARHRLKRGVRGAALRVGASQRESGTANEVGGRRKPRTSVTSSDCKSSQASQSPNCPQSRPNRRRTVSPSVGPQPYAVVLHQRRLP